jgi:hypothetical protein
LVSLRISPIEMEEVGFDYVAVVTDSSDYVDENDETLRDVTMHTIKKFCFL